LSIAKINLKIAPTKSAATMHSTAEKIVRSLVRTKVVNSA